ncbi:hypothetical protein Tco_0468422 [Tanacetum coccineum]
MSKEVGTPRYLSLVVPLKKVGDEAIHKELGDIMERTATTASSLEAEQDSGSGPRCQDTILGGVDAQTRFEITSKQFNDPPLSRGYTLGSREDSMKLLELMELFQVPAAEESDGFAEIIDFLKASSVHYALTVNPIIYTSCIEQFWATAKSSIRSDLHLEDAGGTDCLPTATIFEELARMGYEKPSQKLTFYKAFFSPQWKYFIHTITQCLSAKSTAWNEFSSTMASLIICLATNQKVNLSKYIFDAMVKHLDGGVKFLMYPRFLQVFINQQLGDMSHHKKIFVNPSHTKKVFANMKRAGKDFSRRITPLFDTMMVQASAEVGEDSEVAQDETEHEESVPTPSNDPLPSGEDSMQLNDLMVLCTKLQTQVLDLEKARDAQAKEIADLKKRVQRLERKKKLRTTGLKRLKKVGMSRRVESSEDQESLGDHEDASKQGRRIENIDADVEVTLVNETQERQHEDLMFDTGVLDNDEMFVEATISEKDEQSTKLDDSTAAAKPKVVTTTATTTTTTRPKVREVVVQEPSEFRTPQEAQSSITKDKGKAIMIEPDVPLKRKDQVALDEDLARNLQAQLEAELIEEEKLERQNQEEANIALIESWENTQAMMEADRLLAERLYTREREELTDEEKGKLFMELMEKRRKHFAPLRAQEKRNKPPTKAQKRTQISTYLKHMGGYKHKQLIGKSYDEIQKLFDKEMKRVNTFVAMSSEAQESNEKKEEGSKEKAKGSRKKMLGRKRAGKEQQQESSKKQRMEEDKETDEVEEDDEAELKKHLVIKKDDDIAIDAIPIATKPHGIDREDLLTLWKLVKTKHGDIRPEDEHERVIWGDFKVMFEPDIRSKVWRDLQGYTVTIWKLYDSCGVHFVSAAGEKVYAARLQLLEDFLLSRG